VCVCVCVFVCLYTIHVCILQRPLNSAARNYYCGHLCGPLECACSTKKQILTLYTAYSTHLSALRFSGGIRYVCHLIRSYLLALCVQYKISNTDMRIQHQKKILTLCSTHFFIFLSAGLRPEGRSCLFATRCQGARGMRPRY
jgi:hypothetical protein